jgi:hypothetical protein
MVVHLVPIGGRRYQLYVEIPPEDTSADVPQAEGTGWIARQIKRFKDTLAEAERARLRRENGEPEQQTGFGRFVMRKIAETVAEQRLLWHLRHETAVDVLHPDDLDGAIALREVRAEFQRDAAKHRRWLVIDGAIAAVTGPLLFFVPGPNVVAWYFAFRAAGHFLSWRGARKGLDRIEWRPAASAPLSAIREALGLPAHDRRLQLLAIGERLGLRHLAGFVERVFARRSPPKSNGILAAP